MLGQYEKERYELYRAERAKVNITMMDSDEIHGRILKFDDRVIIMLCQEFGKTDEKRRMIYIHAIKEVSVAHLPDEYKWDEPADGDDDSPFSC